MCKYMSTNICKSKRESRLAGISGGGVSSARTGGVCSSCIQKTAIFSSPPWKVTFPPFPVIARSTLSKGRRGLERFIGEAQNAFCPLIGQWVGFLFGAS